MFSHIKDILEKIPIGQRLIALCILLISVTIMYVTPKVIKVVMLDREHLLKMNEQQEEWLEDDRKTIDKLHKEKKELVEENNDIKIKLDETLTKCSEDLGELRNKNKFLSQNIKTIKTEEDALAINAAIDKTFEEVKYIPYIDYDTIYTSKQTIKKIQMKVLEVKPEKVSLLSKIFKPSLSQQQRQRARLKDLKKIRDEDFILKDTFQIENTQDTLVIGHEKIDTIIIKKDSI